MVGQKKLSCFRTCRTRLVTTAVKCKQSIEWPEWNKTSWISISLEDLQWQSPGRAKPVWMFCSSRGQQPSACWKELSRCLRFCSLLYSCLILCRICSKTKRYMTLCYNENTTFKTKHLHKLNQFFISWPCTLCNQIVNKLFKTGNINKCIYFVCQIGSEVVFLHKSRYKAGYVLMLRGTC